MASPLELHLLYVLLDSNLPTGGFVSSSGLESFAKHGLLGSSYTYSSDPPAPGGAPAKKNMMGGLVEFATAEVKNYGSTTGGFVRDAWLAVDRARQIFVSKPDESSEALAKVLQDVERLDNYHEATLLSHVGRRSSRAQGVAMLTLYARGLSRPTGISEYGDSKEAKEEKVEELAGQVVDGYKRLVRLGKAPGHLAVCWGVVASALGLGIDRAVHIHLFLHARSLLSSAVRLNLIGPYASSQLLLHPFRKIIDKTVSDLSASTTGILHEGRGEKQGEEDFWAWTEEAERGPQTTWPLGEVLTGRHDLQHSRIFNS
ncbi:hypothetical protein L202_04509 [Cryptococcus amylolentus CBS 6039]|uniref:Urease accessory protein UreF n=2 Tax=Cryptococcus amylolentus TaxID=104669 RepID=A0A1E3HRK4_9TREE|nr:hypothetical protein L202_04509 [Cryptococcus amylolentus CBS 6039]ODN78998.1 hypothetical protein L202_04509 [Cryptococcus amylolentus CBS 6039]ODO06558.1 hypothetical protein I350_03913 [Cryptococcus amylolentus CBS 6273]